MNLPPPYPLCWPDHQPRTLGRERGGFRTSLPTAINNVAQSLRLFASDSGKALEGSVITADATPFAQDPRDPGVAVWFAWNGATRCFAIDRYTTLAANLQALHAILEARRTELRHAGLVAVDAIWRGLIALPPPPAALRPPAWHEVLGLPADAGAEAITAQHRALARQFAQDSHRLSAINTARDDGLQERSRK